MEEYELWTDIIQGFNTAIEAGHMSIEEPDEQSFQSSKVQSSSANATGTLKFHSDPSEIVGGGK